jgi:hypothetical protein
MTAIIVISVIYTVNWVRTSVKPTPRASRPPAAGDSRGDRFGAAVEDTVAEVLKDVAPNSPAIQLARGKIYWERAQKNKDAELMKKAEDAFNEVLRLNPDADDEAEAREVLREIAAAKEPIAAP